VLEEAGVVGGGSAHGGDLQAQFGQDLGHVGDVDLGDPVTLVDLRPVAGTGGQRHQGGALGRPQGGQGVLAGPPVALSRVDIRVPHGHHRAAVEAGGDVVDEVVQRTVLNFYTAKRLLHALHLTLERHEAAFGVLEIDVQKRITPGWRG